jgi:pyruvate/2-oxoglutarate dehydrogenase complex dihydrolipoamide dehydrogenase (E3) component
MKVAIVERKLFGGTCVNTGCTPTETLVASAYAAHLSRRAAEFGVAINGQVGVDIKKVMARKDAVSGQSQKSVELWLKQLQNTTVYQGHARFTSPTEMSVGTTLLTATPGSRASDLNKCSHPLKLGDNRIGSKYVGELETPNLVFPMI